MFAGFASAAISASSRSTELARDVDYTTLRVPSALSTIGLDQLALPAPPA